MAWLAVFLFLLGPAGGLQAVDAAKVVVSKPAVVAELSGDALPGFPVRMGWSPDGSEMYIRLVRRDRWANETVFHRLVSLASGQITVTDHEPPWAIIYWAWKSAYAAPGLPDFRIASETRIEQVAPTNSGIGGSLAQNSGDPYGPGFELGPQGQAIVARAMQAQMVTTVTLTVKGQLISEFINTQPQPGLMFGWAPEGYDALAYTDAKRRLVIMDRAGRRREQRGTKGVLLPSWAADGTRIAWLEQVNSGKFVLTIARVTH